ncbi:MAG: sigma-54 dependent transcriptional regulator [Myxococcota bacterium]
MLKVLIADDQDAVRTALRVLFELAGLETLLATSPSEVLHLIATEDVGVVVQDMNFSRDQTTGQEGIALFREIRRLDPDVPVVLLTAFTSLETAVELVKEGAADYAAKPWNDEKLLHTVQNLLRMRRLELENSSLRMAGARAKKALEARYDLLGLVYESPEMQSVVSLAAHVAPSEAPVLILGPNGSGKEKLAEIVHANSRRRAQPFIKVNAGGLPDELLEAELFGAEPGAFTGATKLRIGRFEAAHGGTIFLDEIGNLSLAGQAKILRVLQTGDFERLGSSQARRVDVRVISATNVDLRRAIAEGRFREDLYFRLNVIELELKPLVERPADILPLAAHFLERFSVGRSLSLSADARRALLSHEWHGNVRELQNRIQRAALVSTSEQVRPGDLGLQEEQRAPQAEEPGPAADALSDAQLAERRSIEQALANAGGVVAKAAIALGLSRQALYRRMERLGLVMERKVKG